MLYAKYRWTMVWLYRLRESDQEDAGTGAGQAVHDTADKEAPLDGRGDGLGAHRPPHHLALASGAKRADTQANAQHWHRHREDQGGQSILQFAFSISFILSTLCLDIRVKLRFAYLDSILRRLFTTGYAIVYWDEYFFTFPS